MHRPHVELSIAIEHRALAEPKIHASRSSADFVRLESLDVTVPIGADANGRREPRDGRVPSGMAGGVVDQAVVDEHVDVGRGDAEVKPLFVSRGVAETGGRSPDVVTAFDEGVGGAGETVVEDHRSTLPS